MTERPHWLDIRTARDIESLFRRHGASGAISWIPTIGGDEAVFLVSSTGAARMQEAALTAAVTDRIQRKVWITTDASAWDEEPVPLVPNAGAADS